MRCQEANLGARKQPKAILVGKCLARSQMTPAYFAFNVVESRQKSLKSMK